MLTNTEILCYVLGWQGGTVYEVAKVIGTSPDSILNADDERLRFLCRLAQKARAILGTMASH